MSEAPRTPNWRPLFDAYVRVSGLPIAPSRQRIDALEELHRRGFTADDVEAVLKRILHHIRKGTFGYTEETASFRRAILQVDTFEERALKLRQEKARQPKPAKPVQVSRKLPDGRTETVHGPAPEAEPQVADPAAALFKLAKDLRRQSRGE